MYIFGGQDTLRAVRAELDDTWAYGFTTDSWTAMSDMPVPLTMAAGAALSAEEILVFGGLTGGGASDRTFVYEPNTLFLDGFESGGTDGWTNVILRHRSLGTMATIPY